MKLNKNLLLIVGLLTAYVLFEYYRPKPLDWTPTYQNQDKIPFGTTVLFSLLPDLMRQPGVTLSRLPVENQLADPKLPRRSNYVFVVPDFSISRLDRTRLLAYVRRGNNVFISTYEFRDSLALTLGLKAELKAPTLRDTTLLNQFTNPALRKARYNFFHDDGRNYLTIRNPRHVTVLGRNARREPVFVRIRYGSGYFYIHNLPLAFTNYYVLDPRTADYAPKALSYLPPLPTIWDEYLKQGRFDEDQQSILRYVFTQPALIWVYYIILLGLLFYALFAGKRTQRIIPVVEPPKNTSLDFVQTIGRLYFQQGDHHNLAQKKIQYFLATIRDRYHLPTHTLDADFAGQLARKSGASPDKTLELVRLLAAARRSVGLSENDLLTINHAIHHFQHTD